ncbi:INO80 complex subunit E [Octopus bimaculoides]|uniref:INO80 complex subunit E N-terminal domain-containing protein n=1 Tax=Octopus bimaculoides TaxID=37653 RepID=A0A0L8HBJ8_OCTBM|nr:INO80 complex subunit E [Octopus bimaculoides]|eukprot:XP_014773784.1 PREDICTED: INO80 complex subunit E-like [Octopus bimaculoides]
MMPVSASSAATVTNTDNAIDHQVDYKRKYKNLKSKLKFLVYEQECFLEELRRAQRKLLKVSRDKNFLLDRLLSYENINDSSGDSDATASSESDIEINRESIVTKKKKTISSSSSSVGSSAAPVVTSPPSSSNLLGTDTSTLFVNPSFTNLLSQNPVLPSPLVTPENKKKTKTAIKKSTTKSSTPKAPEPQPERIAGQMTREELERHLESRQHSFGIEKAPAKLPMEIFSNENSDPDSETAQDASGLLGDVDDDAELVIDAPQ